MPQRKSVPNWWPAYAQEGFKIGYHSGATRGRRIFFHTNYPFAFHDCDYTDGHCLNLQSFLNSVQGGIVWLTASTWSKGWKPLALVDLSGNLLNAPDDDVAFEIYNGGEIN